MNYELMVRIANPSVWSVKAKTIGFLVENEEGELMDAEGVTIYELPPMVLTPAVRNQDGDIITPAVFAQQQHVNIDIWGESALAAFETFFDDAVANGQIAQNNKSEVAYRWQGIEVVDPATINSRTNRWFK